MKLLRHIQKVHTLSLICEIFPRVLEYERANPAIMGHDRLIAVKSFLKITMKPEPFKKLQHHRYTQNGILHMLDRNRRIKPRPERFQSCRDVFDVIISCEERVYDQIIEDLESRVRNENQPVHIINIDIQDNHEEATIGAFIIRDLVSTLSECEDIDNEIDEIIQEFESTSNRTILHSVLFV